MNHCAYANCVVVILLPAKFVEKINGTAAAAAANIIRLVIVNSSFLLRGIIGDEII